MKLPYDCDELKPAMSAKTVEVHYGKCLADCVDNLNSFLGDYDLGNLPENSRELAAGIRFLTIPAEDRDKLIFLAGGVANHELFFSILRPSVNGNWPPEELERVMNANFGTFANFQNCFQEVALSLLGSGWVWLCVRPNGKKVATQSGDVPELFICSTQNHDNPSMLDIAKNFGHPILCLDMWEHAYYLQHQNKKDDYIHFFWPIVNWDKVQANYAEAIVARF
jgi:Fe-Mn family superoxide dismutase